jgi:ribosomal protein S27AE
MDKFNFIFKGIISALPFIIIVLTLIVLRSVYLMKKRNTGFKDWLLKEDKNEIGRLVSIGHKRCPECSTPFAESRPVQKCSKCGYELMKTQDEVDSFLNFMHKRYIRQVMPICIFLSFFPVIGFLIGILFLRSTIIMPFGQYIPFFKRFKTKWTMRLLVIGLGVFQIVPGYGAISVPLVAYVKYWYISSAYLELLEKQRKEDQSQQV